MKLRNVQVKVSPTPNAAIAYTIFLGLWKAIWYGFRDFSKLETDVHFAKIDMRFGLAISMIGAAVAFFGFGLVNMLFMLVAWYLGTKQFDDDFAAGFFFSSIPVFFSFIAMLLASLSNIHWFLFLYPAVSVLGLYRYWVTAADARGSILFLEATRLGTFLASKYYLAIYVTLSR